MANSSSSSDTEYCSSECSSNLSLSVGYFPCEDPFCEDNMSCEDTPSKGSPIHFLPPIQGTWWTGSTGRLRRRRDQIEDRPEQFCKLSIALAWDADVGSNTADSITSWDLNGDNQWADKHPRERTNLTLSKLDGLVQTLETFLENQKDDEGDNSVFSEFTQEEDFQLSGSPPPDRAQISQAAGSQKTSLTKSSSVSSGQAAAQEEDASSDTQAQSCLNFGWVFRWLRQQVLPSLRRRTPPAAATQSPPQLAPKKRHSRRSKRIQPAESPKAAHPAA
uniref:Chromosome 12 open reading frame 71 n=1 Tax=Microcebus murinus TaxID=30608 RepID=A0A8C5VWA9_MICMU